MVEPAWLRDLTPAFHDQRIAIVQAPQDYRDADQSAFKAMCYAEYRGFFHIGMITRNERNAIIQHGTMTMVRRAQLDECRWAEWCITEDAELGLRIFEHGYDASYVPETYGRGLMPDTFIDFKKQRFRWAYGAMQILKAHARTLFLEGGPLSPGQRYHFIAGWLPWIADGCNMLFNLAALGWSAAMVWAPGSVDPPLVMYSVLPLSLFTFKLAKLVHLYRVRVGANVRQTLAAAIAGLALTHTIGMATIKGLLTKGEPFFRTPKQRQTSGLWHALAAAREESPHDDRATGLGLGGLPYRHAAERRSRSSRMDHRAAGAVGALCLLARGLPRQRLPAAGVPARHPLSSAELARQARARGGRHAPGGGRGRLTPCSTAGFARSSR